MWTACRVSQRGLTSIQRTRGAGGRGERTSIKSGFRGAKELVQWSRACAAQHEVLGSNSQHPIRNRICLDVNQLTRSCADLLAGVSPRPPVSVLWLAPFPVWQRGQNLLSLLFTLTLLFTWHLRTGDRATLVRAAGTRPPPSRTGNKRSLFSCFSFPVTLLRNPSFVLTHKLWPRSDTAHVSSGGLAAGQPCVCPVNKLAPHLHVACNALSYCLPSHDQKAPPVSYP